MEGVQTSPNKSKLERVLVKWVELRCSDVTWSKVMEVMRVVQFSDVLQSTKVF